MQTIEVKSVSGDASLYCAAAFAFVEAVFPPRNIDACNEPLEIPFPGTRHGFIEIVQIDDYIALGGAVKAKVVDVSITVDDDLHS